VNPQLEANLPAPPVGEQPALGPDQEGDHGSSERHNQGRQARGVNERISRKEEESQREHEKTKRELAKREATPENRLPAGKMQEQMALVGRDEADPVKKEESQKQAAPIVVVHLPKRMRGEATPGRAA